MNTVHCILYVSEIKNSAAYFLKCPLYLEVSLLVEPPELLILHFGTVNQRDTQGFSQSHKDGDAQILYSVVP
jgi:hypothetical protein